MSVLEIVVPLAALIVAAAVAAYAWAVRAGQFDDLDDPGRAGLVRRPCGGGAGRLRKGLRTQGLSGAWRRMARACPEASRVLL